MNPLFKLKGNDDDDHDYDDHDYDDHDAAIVVDVDDDDDCNDADVIEGGYFWWSIYQSLFSIRVYPLSAS